MQLLPTLFAASQGVRLSNKGTARTLGPVAWTVLTLGLLLLTGSCAPSRVASETGSYLKDLSIEELMAIEVTSVSRRPEKLSETASAIQVITDEMIRRSGATSLPEALRLASNLEAPGAAHPLGRPLTRGPNAFSSRPRSGDSARLCRGPRLRPRKTARL